MKKKFTIIVLLFSIYKAEAQTSAFVTIDSLLLKGRYQLALQKLEAIQPPTFASNKKIATIYESIDANKNAIKFYEKALNLKEDYATKVKLGKVYRKEKQYRKAIKTFEEIKAVDAENLLVQYQLGRLYLLTKQPEKSKETFQNLIAKDSQNANYSYQLGLAYAMLKKRNLKINSFLDAYEKDDAHIKSIHQLAVAFTLLRDQDSASIFINRGLKVNPNHIPLNKMQANKLYREERYLDGIKVLEKIDSLQPFELFTQKMLGRNWLKLKNYEEAKKYFRKAKKIDRQDYKIYTYLGQIALEQKELRTAYFNFLQATYVGKEKRDQEYYGLGQVHLEKEETKEAIKMFEKAFRENSKNYKALFQVASKSDDFYKNKKIAYKHYQKYIDRFEKKDTALTNHANLRIQQIKKYYFLKGETIKD